MRRCGFHVCMLQWQAVPLALAGIKDVHGCTPPEVSDFLLDLLENEDNSINPYTNSTFLAIVYKACGMITAANEQVRHPHCPRPPGCGTWQTLAPVTRLSARRWWPRSLTRPSGTWQKSS